MQNPGCLLNDNGSAPCRWVADSVGCASKACWLTLKRPCVSWLWAFYDWTNAAERGLYGCQSQLPWDAGGMSAFEVIKTLCFSRQPSQCGRALWCAHVFYKWPCCFCALWLSLYMLDELNQSQFLWSAGLWCALLHTLWPQVSGLLIRACFSLFVLKVVFSIVKVKLLCLFSWLVFSTWQHLSVWRAAQLNKCFFSEMLAGNCKNQRLLA